MNPPFTLEQFLNVFRDYNVSVWPMQIVFNLLALIILFAIIRKFSFTDMLVNGFLTFIWLWMGIIYHLVFFTTINKAAYAFGSLFILQGLLFFYYGIIKRSVSFSIQKNFTFTISMVFIIYSLLIYPVLGYFFGHQYPSSPTFGLPCPTTIFTFGLLLLSANKLPRPILIIPLLWSVIGFTAAFKFGIWEDTGLLVAGIISSIIVTSPNIKSTNVDQKK